MHIRQLFRLKNMYVHQVHYVHTGSSYVRNENALFNSRSALFACFLAVLDSQKFAKSTFFLANRANNDVFSGKMGGTIFEFFKAPDYLGNSHFGSAWLNTGS